MQHLIRKQQIDLQLDKQLDSFRIQQQFSDQFWKYLVPLLEHEFDKMVTEEEVISLDRIEIDLGVITEAQISQIVWNPDLYELFKTEIKKAIFQGEVLAGDALGAVKRSTPANAYRQWFFYMQNGHLPWTATQVNPKWYDLVLEELATDYASIEVLRREIRGNETFVLRVIRQHPLSFLKKLVEILTAEKQTKFFTAVHQLNDRISDWSVPLQKSRSAKKTAELIRVFNLSYETILKQILKVSVETSGTALRRVLASKIQEMISAAEPGKTDVFLAAGITEGIDQTADKSFPEEKAGVWDQKEGEIQEGVFTTAAGLVLLHPFLNSLFHLLGLLQEKRFLNIDAREKAIYLLHYLATGEKKAEEYELLMPKILCAYPIDQPISKRIKLSDLEMEEADTLLKAAIASWEILKNTSPAGLREGFLQRTGKVQVLEGKIGLQVEKAAIDVLLDHLPWNLSMIKLPWLKDVIRVEWR
ncbi:hypothetical protein DBR43_29455 [Pedobacter sp. KBW06]|uniref:contractile injection system tape measure protein n=1 Tax=Pedobacter sp. KBW06 TaxID=2153359 RepID=UPI000F5B3F94|nr:contractile injection system tape measure protein [Pedobacter sp. KBW06]RQO66350.1 hypothetical protein DBR43_29455 [Pedobacter sp. KBW06]